MRGNPPVLGLRAALILLVLIAFAPVFVVVAQASLAEQLARLQRAEASLRSLVELAAAQQQHEVEVARQVLTAIAFAPPVVAGDPTGCAGYLRKLQSQYPEDFGRFGVLDLQGRLTCRATPPPTDVRSDDRPFFRAAVQGGRFTVGEFTVSRASGLPVLTFGLPVHGDRGELRGVAYFALHLSHAREQLGEIASAHDFTLLVADPDRVVLASAGPGAPEPGQLVRDGIAHAALETGRPMQGRMTDAGGTEWLLSMKPVGRAGERSLYVAGYGSKEGVLAPSAARLRAQFAALVLVMLLAAALAWVFADRVLVGPVERLLGQVDTLAQEHALPEPAPRSTVREFGDLHGRFHDIARRLSERAVQRDAALAEMAHQKDLLESVLESMAEGVFVLDAQGRFVHVNDAARRILPGFPALGRTLSAARAPAEDWGLTELDGTPVAFSARPTTRALRGEPVEHYRYLVRGALSGGREIVLEGSARPISKRGEAPAGAVLVFSDATEAYGVELARQAAEEALRELNESLEGRVADRTRALAQANQELESFSYSVSHDLRAPLQVIDGFSRTLGTRYADRLDGQAVHYLQRIRENTRQMAQLIDDLLALARVTRADMLSEAFDLAKVADGVLQQLHQRDPDRAVEVLVQRPMPCRGDPRLMAVVMENLLSNAWKFTSRTPRARIEIGMETDEGRAVYYVGDNGAGFDMEYADKLFKAFQRLHASSDFEGTGIGLATVQRIVERHGGRVWAVARAGEGARFMFTLAG